MSVFTQMWGGRPRPRRTPRSGFGAVTARPGGRARVWGPAPPQLLALAVAFTLLSGCRMVGPNYTQAPPLPSPPSFKEQGPANFKEAEAEGWKQSQPGDAFTKGKWWEVYNDPALNALEEQVSISNQNVLQAEALYREAKAAVRAARAGLYPDRHHHSRDYRERFGRALRRACYGGIGSLGQSNHACSICRSARVGNPISGAASGAASPLPPPRRKPPKAIWKTPSCCTRASSRRIISVCAGPMPKRSCSGAPTTSYEEYLDADAQPLQRRGGLGSGRGASRSAALRRRKRS